MTTRVDKSPAFVCIKSEEISGINKNLNALVTCKKDKCGFKIRFDAAESCQIDADKGTVYSYISTKDNDNMSFEVKGSSQNDTLMQIGLEGSNTAKIIVDDVDNPVKVNYEGAKFISYKIGEEQNETTLAKFNISNAKVGEYICITIYTVNDYKGPDNLLYPGGPSVMGLVH